MKGVKIKMRNKKLIALICALSMIVSLFTSFTVVNAEGEGMYIEVTQATTTNATVTAKYSGFDNGIGGAKIKISVPSGATVTHTCTMPGAVLTPNDTVDGQYTLVIGFQDDTPAEGNVIATFDITLPEALTSNFKVELLEGSEIMSNDGTYLTVKDGTIAASSGTILADPSKTPEVVLPKPDVDPDVELPPTRDEVTVDNGIVLEYDEANSTDTTKVILAKYVGTSFETNGIGGAKIKLSVPSGATVTHACTMPGAVLTPNDTVDGQYTLVVGFQDDTKAEGNVIATFTITLAEPMNDDFVVELLSGSEIMNNAGEYLTMNDDLKPAWVKVPGTGASLDNKMPLIKDENGDGLVSAPSATLSNKAYAALEVKKADGTPATYNEDYVAYYKGEKLTKEQLDNLLAGAYVNTEDDDPTNDSLLDMLKDVELQYNNGITGKLQIVDEDQDGTPIVVVSGETPSDAEPTPPPAAPALTVKASKTTAYVGDEVTVTANVSNGKTPVSLTAKVLGNGDDFITGFKATDDEQTATSAKYRFRAALATESKKPVQIQFTYTYKDDSNVEQTIDEVASVTIKTKQPGNGGGGSDDDDDDNTLLVVPGLNGSAPHFEDLGTVPWAEEAINALAAKGIINGRSETIFDPDSNITRAEYCQILVGAIGRTSEYADSSFLDVPTDAWFYHAVAVASKLGIVEGYGDGNFGPYNLITRQDMALMTMKAAQVFGKPLTAVRAMAFADADQVSDYAATAVQTLADAGIINGVSDTEFAPKANATRAQAAKILYDTFVK